MIVFSTPGELDVRGITTFGVNVKPNTENPIGYFGTGLKYAIATLVRTGHRIRIVTRGVEYSFTKQNDDFRGSPIEYIYMQRTEGLLRKWSKTQMPFTTALGKRWELWMAYRELESNTRDEGGSTFVVGSLTDPNLMDRTKRTLIIVEGQDFEDLAKNNTVFLDWEKHPMIDSIDGIEVRQGSNQYLYYRGLRVYETKPSLYTYNFTRSVFLTEDRTLEYYHTEMACLASVIIQLKDQKVIGRIISAAEGRFERELPFDNMYTTAEPSDVFIGVAKGKMSLERKVVAPRVTTYVNTIDKRATPTLSDYDRGWNNALEQIACDMESDRSEMPTPSDIRARKRSLVNAITNDAEIPF